MISGFLDVYTTPKTKLFISGDTRIPQIIPEKNEMFSKILFGEIAKFEKSFSGGTCGNMGAPKNHEGPFNEFLESLNMGSISLRKHEMDIW